MRVLILGLFVVFSTAYFVRSPPCHLIVRAGHAVDCARVGVRKLAEIDQIQIVHVVKIGQLLAFKNGYMNAF